MTEINEQQKQIENGIENINVKEENSKEKRTIKIVEKTEMKEDLRRLEDIDVDKIIVGEANPRKTDPEKDINILIESMRRFGLMNPIEVRKRRKRDDGDSIIYMVNEGQRRTMAARALGWTKIKAWILPDTGEYPIEDDPERAFREQVDKLDLDPRDRSIRILELKDKYNGDWILLSEMLNRPAATLQNWAKIGEMSQEMQKMISEDKIGETVARKIARYSEVSPSELVKIAERVGSLKGDTKRRDAIIEHIKKKPDTTVEEIDKKFISENREEGLSMTISFNPRVAKAIRDICEKRSEEPGEFIKGIITKYLEDKGVFEP